MSALDRVQRALARHSTDNVLKHVDRHHRVAMADLREVTSQAAAVRAVRDVVAESLGERAKGRELSALVMDALTDCEYVDLLATHGLAVRVRALDEDEARFAGVARLYEVTHPKGRTWTSGDLRDALWQARSGIAEDDVHPLTRVDGDAPR